MPTPLGIHRSLLATLALTAGVAQAQVPADGAPRELLDHLDVYFESAAFEVTELHVYLPRTELAPLSREGLWLDRLAFAPASELAATSAIELSLAVESIASAIAGRGPDYVVDRSYSQVYQHGDVVTKVIKPLNASRSDQAYANIERETPRYYLDYEPANRHFSLFEPGYFVSPFSLREALRPFALGPSQEYWLAQREWREHPDAGSATRAVWSYGHQDGLGAATLVLEANTGRLLASRSSLGLVEGALPSIGVFGYDAHLGTDDASGWIPHTGVYMNPSEESVHLHSYSITGLKWGQGELKQRIPIAPGSTLFDLRSHPTQMLSDLPAGLGDRLHNFVQVDPRAVTEASFSASTLEHQHGDEVRSPLRERLRWALLGLGVVLLGTGLMWGRRRA